MLLIIISLFGLVIGSFISAVSFRYPKNISVVKGRSFCDYCRKKISWYDNIPLISYILLGGKCRHCKKHISFRYPAIEIATAAAFVALTFKGVSLQGVYSIIIFLILELIFIIDLEHQIIPDTFTFFGLLVIVLYLLLVPNPYSLFTNLFAGFAAALFLLLISLATGGRGMGLGDVKFAVLGGLLMGKFTFIWMLTAFLTGGVVGSILILGRKAGLKDKIAFGPFLVIGIFLAEAFGNSILSFLNF